MLLQYLFGLGVLFQRILLPANFEEDVSQLVVFVCHWQAIRARQLDRIDER